MKLHRFIVSNLVAGQIQLDDQELYNQWKNVLRLEPGVEILLTDGQGQEALAKIVTYQAKQVLIDIGEVKIIDMGEGNQVTLCCAVLKKENFELVSEKATELGVSRIVPLCTERTLLKNLNPERIEKILMEASEQSGRGDVPVLCGSTNLQDALEKESKEERKIIICDMDGVSAKDFDFGSTLSIFIGPEGGWSEKEKEIFEKYNTQTISLGSLTLRAETAAIAALAFAGI